MEKAAPNAFAPGRSPRHAVVAVARGLLAVLEPAELAQEGSKILANASTHEVISDERMAQTAARLGRETLPDWKTHGR